LGGTNPIAALFRQSLFRDWPKVSILANEASRTAHSLADRTKLALIPSDPRRGGHVPLSA